MRKRKLFATGKAFKEMTAQNVIDSAKPKGYKETFLKRNDIKTRQCVYIGYDTHSVIAKLIRALADTGSEITLGGYIDTVLNEHLQANKEEINKIYRQRDKDLL